MRNQDLFVGRLNELERLNLLYKKNSSQMVVIYGRRRVGKSTLIERFCKNKTHIYFIGRKGEKEQSIFGRLLKQLAETHNNPLIARLKVEDWKEIFELMDFHNRKIIIVFDEFQWMCPKKSVLISALQEIWDKKWMRNKKIFLILCGSIISFIEKNVLSEKSPLYGRRTDSFELEPLPPSEAKHFFPRKSPQELCQILMVFGGIPSYLELIDPKESFAQNINRLALTKDAYFVDEIQFVIRERLKSYARYSLLLENISEKSLSREEIAHALGINNSGVLDMYLKNLQNLHLIKMDIPITKPVTAKTQKYMIWDEFLRFYYCFIFPMREQIQLNSDDWLFDKVVLPRWDSFCGYAFELFCRKNIKSIIIKLGINNVFRRSGTYWHRGTALKPGLEIDLVIERTDKTTHLIECKWSAAKIGSSIINEMLNKKNCYPNPYGHSLKTVLITTHGITDDVKKSAVFDDVLMLSDFLQ